jgi:hypothetical protein
MSINNFADLISSVNVSFIDEKYQEIRNSRGTIITDCQISIADDKYVIVAEYPETAYNKEHYYINGAHGICIMVNIPTSRTGERQQYIRLVGNVDISSEILKELIKSCMDKKQEKYTSQGKLYLVKNSINAEVTVIFRYAKLRMYIDKIEICIQQKHGDEYFNAYMRWCAQTSRIIFGN